MGKFMRHCHMKIICGVSWTMIIGFAAASVWYWYSLHQLAAEAQKPGAFIFMGVYAVTDPLCLLVGYAAPVAALGATTLAYVVYRGGRRWPACVGMVLTFGTAFALITFGAQFFRNSLPGQPPLSSQIWWMSGVWKFLGV
jgi:hypothetical protein